MILWSFAPLPQGRMSIDTHTVTAALSLPSVGVFIQLSVLQAAAWSSCSETQIILFLSERGNRIHKVPSSVPGMEACYTD